MKKILCAFALCALAGGCTSLNKAVSAANIPTTVAKAEVAWLQIEDRDPISDEHYPPETDKSFWDSVVSFLAAPFEGMARVLGLKALTDTAEEFARQTANVKLNTKYTRLSIGANEDMEQIMLEGVELGRFRAETIIVDRVKRPPQVPASQPAGGTEGTSQ